MVSWMENYNRLVEQAKKYGHCEVSIRHDRELVEWSEEQRRNKNGLKAAQINALDNIGFRWRSRGTAATVPTGRGTTVRAEANAGAGTDTTCITASDNRSYRSTKSDTSFGETTSAGSSMKSNTNTYEVPKGSSDLSKKVRPESAEPNGLHICRYKTWQAGFAALVKYKDIYGDCNIPSPAVAENKDLARWAQSQRDKDLTPVQREKLLKLGFILGKTPQNHGNEWFQFSMMNMGFDPTTFDNMMADNKSKENEGGRKTWEDMFVSLVRYKEEQGTCRVVVGCKETLRLSQWVRFQCARRGALSREKWHKLWTVGVFEAPKKNELLIQGSERPAKFARIEINTARRQPINTPARGFNQVSPVSDYSLKTPIAAVRWRRQDPDGTSFDNNALYNKQGNATSFNRKTLPATPVSHFKASSVTNLFEGRIKPAPVTCLKTSSAARNVPASQEVSPLRKRRGSSASTEGVVPLTASRTSSEESNGSRPSVVSLSSEGSGKASEAGGQHSVSMPRCPCQSGRGAKDPSPAVSPLLGGYVSTSPAAQPVSASTELESTSTETGSSWSAVTTNSLEGATGTEIPPQATVKKVQGRPRSSIKRKRGESGDKKTNDRATAQSKAQSGSARLQSRRYAAYLRDNSMPPGTTVADDIRANMMAIQALTTNAASIGTTSYSSADGRTTVSRWAHPAIQAAKRVPSRAASADNRATGRNAVTKVVSPATSPATTFEASTTHTKTNVRGPITEFPSPSADTLTNLKTAEFEAKKGRRASGVKVAANVYPKIGNASVRGTLDTSAHSEASPGVKATMGSSSNETAINTKRNSRDSGTKMASLAIGSTAAGKPTLAATKPHRRSAVKSPLGERGRTSQTVAVTEIALALSNNTTQSAMSLGGEASHKDIRQQQRQIPIVEVGGPKTDASEVQEVNTLEVANRQEVKIQRLRKELARAHKQIRNLSRDRKSNKSAIAKFEHERSTLFCFITMLLCVVGILLFTSMFFFATSVFPSA